MGKDSDSSHCNFDNYYNNSGFLPGYKGLHRGAWDLVTRIGLVK